MDERRVDRVVSDAEIICRIDGVAHWLPLFDLSTQGCMMDVPAGLELAGRSVLIEFEQDVVMPADVIWQHDNAVGARFAHSLPDPLVAKLAFKVTEPEAAGGALASRRSSAWP